MNALTELARARFTADQFCRMGDAGAFEGRNVILINGEIIEMPAEGARHFAAVHRVLRVLERCYGPGFLIRRPGPLPLNLDTDPEPDIAVVRGSIEDFETQHPRSALLVVEVSETTLHYDRGFKRRLYAEGGIGEYWVVNLPDQRLEIFRDRRGEGEAADYSSELSLQASERILPPHAQADFSIGEFFSPHPR